MLAKANARKKKKKTYRIQVPSPRVVRARLTHGGGKPMLGCDFGPRSPTVRSGRRLAGRACANRARAPPRAACALAHTRRLRPRVPTRQAPHIRTTRARRNNGLASVRAAMHARAQASTFEESRLARCAQHFSNGPHFLDTADCAIDTVRLTRPHHSSCLPPVRRRRCFACRRRRCHKIRRTASRGSLYDFHCDVRQSGPCRAHDNTRTASNVTHKLLVQWTRPAE